MIVFPFTPSASAVFQFQPVLDGLNYNASTPWSAFGNRYYLSLLAIDGTQIWYGAVVGSPTGSAIATLSWANGVVAATTKNPHGYRIASAIALSTVGCAPDAYNGNVNAIITGPSSFSWPLPANPGPATVLGSANYDINLIGGVAKEDGTFFASKLLFRVPANQFEVWP